MRLTRDYPRKNRRRQAAHGWTAGAAKGLPLNFDMTRQARGIPLKKFGWKGLAFCTILSLSLGLATARGQQLPAENPEYFQQYRQNPLIGAQTYPLSAQLKHRQALQALESGETDKAERLLAEAFELDPGYAGAYFTLTRIKARQLSSDTFYYLSKALIAVFSSFHYQRLLVLNTVLFLFYYIAVLASVICLAFSVKYLPFVAHKLKEMLVKRFNLALPRLATYSLLLVPFALLPGFVTGIAVLIVFSWGFMLKREKLLTVVMVLPFLAIGFFSGRINRIAPAADPTSLSSRIAEANLSHGDPRLITEIENLPAGDLKIEKNLALGLLHLRSENFLPAASHFLAAIADDPTNQMAYVNLGNVYYLQGEYNKALEGYRKAAALDTTDAICQYNLAQGYIKTLLLAESSRALRSASASGIEKVKQSYAPSALKYFPVYPKPFSIGQLWHITAVDSRTYKGGGLDGALVPLTRFTSRVSAWILLGALVLAMMIFHFLDRKRLTFQCTNCGELTCNNCCSEDRGGYYCRGCAEAIDGVFSEKVIDALLRQRRQAVIVKRRKSIRLVTSLIPGIRDLYYGRIMRGLSNASLFSLALVFLWTGGTMIGNWMSLSTDAPRWQFIAAVSAIVLSYLISIFGKSTFDGRSFLSAGGRIRGKEHHTDGSSTGVAA
jgi:tetratricopeptide (TPR) repeat protein